MPLVKVNFQFSLPDEREEIQAPKVRRAASEFADWLRRMNKNTDEKFWPTAADFAADFADFAADPKTDNRHFVAPKFDPVFYEYFFNKTRKKFWQCFEDEGATLD
jgi:hypothetical protein